MPLPLLVITATLGLVGAAAMYAFSRKILGGNHDAALIGAVLVFTASILFALVIRLLSTAFGS